MAPHRSEKVDNYGTVLKFEHFIQFCFGLNFAFYAVVSNTLCGLANSVDTD